MMGECVHLIGDAEAADVSWQTARAFGSIRKWASRLERVRKQFPGISYRNTGRDYRAVSPYKVRAAQYRQCYAVSSAPTMKR
jgi:hypothetical protein